MKSNVRPFQILGTKGLHIMVPVVPCSFSMKSGAKMLPLTFSFLLIDIASKMDMNPIGKYDFSIKNVHFWPITRLYFLDQLKLKAWNRDLYCKFFSEKCEKWSVPGNDDQLMSQNIFTHTLINININVFVMFYLLSINFADLLHKFFHKSYYNYFS